MVASQSVRYGGKASVPNIGTRTGYTFKGWFTSSDGGNTFSDTAFAFETAITGNVSLYVNFEVISYTVTFDSKGGSAVDSQIVNHGGKATAPTRPTSVAYDFVGWYTSTDGGETLSDTVFDFDTEITGDITLYANWYLDLSNCTAENVVAKIEAMTESGTVVVSDFISYGSEIFINLKEAINKKTFGVGIDLKGLTCNTKTNLTKNFKDSVNLINITLPNFIYQIDNYAFEGCTNLESVTIPDSVTSIGDFAFRGCTSLTSITIPESVKEIKGYGHL